MTSDNKFLIVGIGASAGGIQALRAFFENVPADSGMAYVVILHLSPDHDSQLAAILQNVAKIPVSQVTERVKVEPNCVYVVPPNQHLQMVDGEIVVTPNATIEDRRAPVDIFFRTLAESHEGRAIAVILSGTGANGSMGIKRVKEKGGAAFVQSPHEAEFSEMPRNSIATDLIDEVLSVSEIPAQIIAYKESLGTVEIAFEPAERPEEQQQALREIFTQLRVRTGHDFSNYKRPTLMRRIERRINIRHLPDVPSYAAYMREQPEETQALLKDLLISVTNFFRDQKAFEVIERDILPRIIHEKKDDEPVRLWSIGCATGEEAYSLAMLCAERISGVVDAPQIQIFATDIDNAAIAKARDGLYSLNDAADVSPERLRRFFSKEGDEYRIHRDIREMILFAHHNALKDPPFSHLDLVTCRNMLIYLNQMAQERVMETIHFALNPGGVLFLGSSESVDGAGDLFASTNRDYRIYQSREATTGRPYPVPESIPTFRSEPSRAVQLSDNGNVNGRPDNGRRERISYGDLHGQLLEQYAPPSIVVNEEYDILHVSERAGHYLQVAGGELSNNLLKLIRPELRLELRTALYQATQRRTNVEARNLQVRVDERSETINIQVRPVLGEGDTARGFLLIIFAPSTANTSDTESVFASDEPIARQLEAELIRLKAQLRTSNEHHEIQSEELRASNEELQALNEELRSAAEELETGKEELQSINEELTTVNQELKVKIEEATLSSNNLQNLINSADIGTIFLDRSLRVNLFTPAAQAMFNLISTDYGRPLADITNRFGYEGLLVDAETVLEKLQSVEREVQTGNNRNYLMRVRPYRTADDRIQGVVMTFVDITARKHAEEELRGNEERYRIAVEGANLGTCDWHYKSGELHWNDQHFFMLGMEPRESLFHEEFMALVHPGDVERLRQELRAGIEEAGTYEVEFRIVREDNGAVRWMNNAGRVVERDETGHPARVGNIIFDITARREAEEALKTARDPLEGRVAQRTMELQQSKTLLEKEIAERLFNEKAREQLMERIVTIQEEERRRISRELHDQMGQQLTALLMGLKTLPEWPEPGLRQPSYPQQIEKLSGMAMELTQRVQRLAWEMRPAALDNLGLKAALQQYVDEWSTHHTTTAHFVELNTTEEGVLPENVEIALYRVAQEALTNVQRHAQAGNVSVLLERDKETIAVIIEDDGQGFKIEESGVERASRHLGLLGMKERMELVGGTLTIESSLGTGTTIYARVAL